MATVPNAPMYPYFWMTNDATEIRLYWELPTSDGGSIITGYKPQYKTATDSAWIDATPNGLSMPVIISNLTPGQPYQFRVFAINDIGTSEASSVTSATLVPRQITTVPIPATEPDAPTALVATPGNTQVKLSWTAPSDNGGSSITGYTVQQSVDSGSTWTASTFTLFGTTTTVTGLTNGEQYSFRVLAVNSIGIGDPSNVVTATPTTQQTAPDAPIRPYFWMIDDATEVRLYWTVPASDGGSAITGYKAQYKISTSPTWIDDQIVTSAPTTISNLTPNEPYQFRVIAINSIGNSEPSRIVSATLEPRN